MTLPHPAVYIRGHSLLYFAVLRVLPNYSFLASDIRRASEIKLQLVRKVSCDSRRGGVWGVEPPLERGPSRKRELVDTINTKAKSSAHRKQSLALSLLHRVTTPLLNRRRSMYPLEADESTEVGMERPKYLPPEKLLPPLPADEATGGAGVLIDEKVIDRVLLNGWQKNIDHKRDRKHGRLMPTSKRSSRIDMDTNSRIIREAEQAMRRVDGASLSGSVQQDGDGSKGVKPDGVIWGLMKIRQESIISLRWEGVSVEVCSVSRIVRVGVVHKLTFRRVVFFGYRGSLPGRYPFRARTD
jgi:hypothetical protein